MSRRHGTVYHYDLGCRCDLCREAKRVLRKKQRDRARAEHRPSYLRELARSRALKERYRGTCQDCGAPTSWSDSKRPIQRCVACDRASKAAQHGTRSKYQAGCRCDDCRRANRESQRRLKGRQPPSHGYSGYKNYGCRCQVCKDGNLVYERSNGWEHQKAWAKRVRGTEPPKHGTLTAYKAYGCRCDHCRAAGNAYKRARRQARKVAA